MADGNAQVTVAAPEVVTEPPHRPRRATRLVVAAVALAVLAVALLFVALGQGGATTAPLDPRNPGPTGAQALATVLDRHAVDVTVARSEAELQRAGIDGDTTVLVADGTDLGRVTTESLASLSRAAERLVLVDPPREVVRVLSPGVGVTKVRHVEQDLVASGCASSDVHDGETLSRSESAYDDASAVATCFVTDGHAVYLAMPRTPTTAPLVLFGSPTAMTNEQVTEASNAAILLRMLGHSGRLVWYVPSRADVPVADAGTGASVVPRWLGPSALLATFVVVGVMLWRGRRLGPLVKEPLPVVVKAIETTQSRGRLYRRSRDANRAGLVLQEATRSRLRAYIGLPSAAPTGALVQAVAGASGRPATEVGSLLAGPPPADDGGLLGLATQLAALEKEVRRT